MYVYLKYTVLAFSLISILTLFKVWSLLAERSSKQHTSILTPIDMQVTIDNCTRKKKQS